MNYSWVFTPILYFQPSPSQSDLRQFHFQPFRYLLTASAAVLSGFFYPQAFFYLLLHRRHFTYVYQGLPGSWQFFLEVFRASGIQNDSFLNSTIYQHELLAVKSLVYMLFTRFKLLSLVQDICKGYQKSTLNKTKHVPLITASMNIKVILSIIENNRCLMDERCF